MAFEIASLAPLSERSAFLSLLIRKPSGASTLSDATHRSRSSLRDACQIIGDGGCNSGPLPYFFGASARCLTAGEEWRKRSAQEKGIPPTSKHREEVSL